MRLKLERRADGWWIVGGELDCGAYDTRREAAEDRRGLEAAQRFANEPGFWSVDSRAARPAAQRTFFDS